MQIDRVVNSGRMTYTFAKITDGRKDVRVTLNVPGFRWSPRIAIAITRKLNARRDRIADLLSIDPDDGEWIGVPPDYPDAANANDVAAFIAWREAPPEAAQRVSRIDALIEDLTDTLCLAWALHRDVNRAASDPLVRKNLCSLLRQPDHIRDRIWRTDPNTRGIVEALLPEGRQTLETDDQTDEQLHAAVVAALASLPTPKRGRPANSVDHASRFLGERLAEIFETYFGRRPTRRVHPKTHAEYGVFHEFVTIVLSVVPRRLFQYKSAPVGSITKNVDNIVRLGVESRAPSPATRAP